MAPKALNKGLLFTGSINVKVYSAQCFCNCHRKAVWLLTPRSPTPPQWHHQLCGWVCWACKSLWPSICSPSKQDSTWDHRLRKHISYFNLKNIYILKLKPLLSCLHMLIYFMHFIHLIRWQQLFALRYMIRSDFSHAGVFGISQINCRFLSALC